MPALPAGEIKIVKAPIVASASLALAALCLGAAQPAWAEDVPGSSDHPALTRFKGAEIRAYERKDYDEAFMPNQPIAEEATAKVLELEGKVTRISYRIGGDKSALEVYRNYQGALQSGGFKTVFECKGDDQCGRDFQAFVNNGGKVRPTGQGDAAFGGKYYVVLAKKEAPSGDIYVFLDVMEDASNQITPVYVQVLETQPMQTGQVQVLDMAAMQKSLAESGRVAVYGVYFDTDKAEVKPESRAALDEMGKLLKANANLKVYVVGHTDNQGTLARNLELSQKRADAVVKALETDYKIAAARLSPRGVASLAPVAANDAEAGRARNRRVELVVQ
jgi:outer membrane protein OmpA-like peptidoglycan-associated protein